MHEQILSAKLDHISMAVCISAALVFLMASPLRAQTNEPWTANQVIQPAQLAATLKSPGEKPIILQIGFRRLYDEGHIPGSPYCGPASNSNGIKRLKGCLAKVPRTREIVLYCGCCPWQECPNIRPAFNALRAMGYTRLKVVEIAHNFGVDWLAKGYPTTSGKNP